jgi:ferredoxin-NADP reductase
LIYSVRSPEEFAYMDEFQRLEDEGRLDFRHTVTRAATEGWTGRQGRIDASCLEGLVVPGDTLCFLCGPPSLVGEIPPQLRELGVREDQIRLEQWT